MKAPLWSMLGLAVLSGAGLATLGAAAMEGCPGVDGEGVGVGVLRGDTGQGRSRAQAQLPGGLVPLALGLGCRGQRRRGPRKR